MAFQAAIKKLGVAQAKANAQGKGQGGFGGGGGGSSSSSSDDLTVVPGNAYEHRALTARMIRVQQLTGYPCLLYRKGLVEYCDTREHQLKASQWQVPVPGPRWTSHKSNSFFGTDQIYEIKPFGRSSHVQVGAGPPARPDPPPAAAQKAIDQAKIFVETNSEFRIKKVLGWGGMGAVLMAETKDPRGGQQQSVVIKINIKEKSKGFLREKKNMIQMARAAHIIQNVVVEDKQQRKIREQQEQLRAAPATKRQYADGAADAAFQVPKKARLTVDDRGKVVAAPAYGVSPRDQIRQPLGRAIFNQAMDAVNFIAAQPVYRSIESDPDINTHPDLMLIEPMARGDFEIWVRKMATSGQKFHSKVLWLIFECLFKGVLAMAHPPQHYHDWAQTGGGGGPQVEERLRDPRDPIPFDKNAFIHFDLDMLNILVGDFNVPTQNSHSITPNIKIADLGLGKNMSQEKDHFFEMWQSRFIGKPYTGWLSPEQFHPEWDYIKFTPSATRNFQVTVAGQYSWKTNLYWVGQVMWCLITLCKPSKMPFPYWISGKCGIGQKENGFWSWGGLLNNPRYNHIDEDLRAAIVSCMADAPADRPGVAQLGEWIRQRTTAEWGDLPEEEARKWAAKFFEQPGAPGPKAATTVFNQPAEVKVEPPAAKQPRPPWNKIPDLAGISPSTQSHDTNHFDFSYKLPGQWPQNPSYQRLRARKKPAQPSPLRPKPGGLAGILPRFFRPGGAPAPAQAPANPLPPPNVNTPPAKGPFGNPRRKPSGVKQADVQAAVKTAKDKQAPQAKAVPQPQNPAQKPAEKPTEPAAPVAGAPAARALAKQLNPTERIKAAAGVPPRRLTPKERIQQAFETTAGNPAPVGVYRQPPQATNAVAGRVRAFRVPSSSPPVTDPASAAAAIAKDMALATERARAERGRVPSPSTVRRSIRIGAGVNLLQAARERAPSPSLGSPITRVGPRAQLGPQTQSSHVRGKASQPHPPHKQVKFQTPAPIAADEVVPFLPHELMGFRGKKAQQLLDMIDRDATPAPAPRPRRVGGRYQPPQQQQQPQAIRPPQPNLLPQQPQQVPQQILTPQQPPVQQPQLKLPTAFAMPSNLPAGSALPRQKTPGPPTPLVRRLNPLVNRRAGGQYDLRGRRNFNILRGPGPSRLKQGWAPLDLGEGGRARRAGSGLFAGLRIRRGPTAGQAPGPAVLREQVAGKAEAEPERDREAPVPVQGPGAESKSWSPPKGPSQLIVGWEHLQEEPVEPTPEEREQERLALERWHARARLLHGSLLGKINRDKESSDSDVEMQDADVAEEDAESKSRDRMDISKPQQTVVSRVSDVVKRLGNFGYDSIQ